MWPRWVSDLADDKLFQSVAGVGSILALLITFRVWSLASRISHRISANVRLPVLGRALRSDLTDLNRLHLAEAPVHDIMACLARCRSRLRSIRRYHNSSVPKRRLLTAEMNFARFMQVLGRERSVRRISRLVYGEMMAVVVDIEEFSARIPLGANDG